MLLAGLGYVGAFLVLAAFGNEIGEYIPWFANHMKQV